MGTIKFNFYSTLMHQTITVEGKMDNNWNREVFVVNKIYAERHKPIVSDDVKTEATEFFKANEQDLVKDKNSL